jgi:hypothetical protein
MRKMNPASLVSAALAALPVALFPAISPAQSLYSDGFSSAGDASNYGVYYTTLSGGTASSDATFAYDYSALGIPSAPHTTDGSTLGLRLRVDNLGNTFGSAVGAISVITKGLSLPSQYSVSVDLWGNYIGSGNLGVSGGNGSTAAGMGLGTSGAGLQSPNGNTGFLADAFHDGGGGANLDYRIYANSTRQAADTTPYFAAGQSSTAASHGNAYYSFLTSHTAPGAQTTLSSATQGGSTPVGIIGFAWHTMTLTQDGTQVTWSIDGHTIATVPDSALTFDGSQVSLDAIDSSTGGNTTAINQLLNADIWDNLTVQAVPEPASLSLFGLGALGLFLARRRK